LDYMSESARRRFDNTEKAAHELLDSAYPAGGRLYLKTHAHSLHPYYFEHARSPIFPHQHPAIQTLLSVVFEAAAAADCSIDFSTAPEVYDRLLAEKEKPAIDLVEVYLRSGRSPSTPLLSHSSSYLGKAIDWVQRKSAIVLGRRRRV